MSAVILKGNADLVPFHHPIVLSDGRVPCDICHQPTDVTLAELHAHQWGRAVCARCHDDLSQTWSLWLGGWNE